MLNFFGKIYQPKIAKIEHIGYNLLISDEVNKIETDIKLRNKPVPPELIELSSSRALWRISLKNSDDKFMTFTRTNHISDDDYIVYLDTELFYLTCLNLALSSKKLHYTLEYVCKIRKDLPKDYKYSEAEGAFAHDIKHPVSLADMTAGLDFRDNNLFIAFTNGITRTIWLINNYAFSFPIYTRGLESANYLNDIAGLTNNPLQIERLFDDF